MAASPKQVAWDSCAWIALIKKENVVEEGIERYTRCRSVIDQAASGKLEIVCSALCLTEVCKNYNTLDADEAKIAAYFEHDYLITAALGRDVAEKARKLIMSGVPGLKPADACHLATALEAPKVAELHTFDVKLLNQNGKLAKRDGTMLKICLPDVGAPLPPLLKEALGG